MKGRLQQAAAFVALALVLGGLLGLSASTTGNRIGLGTTLEIVGLGHLEGVVSLASLAAIGLGLGIGLLLGDSGEASGEQAGG